MSVPPAAPSPDLARLDPPALAVATAVASGVVDPELPMLSLADLGVLRAVEADGDTVVVTITPTYTGCPALATMRADLQVALRRAGFTSVEVRTSLSPAWTSDWITPTGRAALRDNGISPPEPTSGSARPDGPVWLELGAAAPSPTCPHCGSTRTRELSRFGSTACRSLHSCRSCGEPFDQVKAI